MTTLTRNLTQIDGANVVAPTQNGFSTTSWEVFANDAAYEAVYGAGQQGDCYFNSTDLLLRAHNGTEWVYLQNGINALTDSSTTGAAQDLDPTYHNLLKVSNASLTSVRSLDSAKTLICYLNNSTGSDITILHDDGTATAAKRILLPDNSNLTLADGNTAHFVYDALSSRWRYTNAVGDGGSGTGTGAKNYVTSPDSSTSVTDVGGSVSTDTTTVADLPEESKGIGVLITQTSGAIGNTSTFEVTAIDEGDGGCNGAPEMYYKTKSGYTDDDCSIQWYNSDTATVLYTQDIKAGSGRISKGVADIPLTTGENIKPRIYWNVTDSNGLVVSGAGTLAETRLVGDGGYKEYDIGPGGLNLVTMITGGATITFATTKLQKSIGDKWRLTGNLVGSWAGTQSVHDFTISGITPEPYNQAVNAGVNQSRAHWDQGLSRFNIRPSVAEDELSVSWDILLSSKPTWADFDGSVMFGTEAQAQNARVRRISNNEATTNGSTVQFATADYLKGGGSFSSGLYTVPADGEYTVEFSIRTSESGLQFYSIEKNGSQVAIAAQASASEYAQTTTTISCSAGDTISVQNDSGATRTTLANNTNSTLSINRVADKSSKATGFPFADQIPGEYGMVKVWSETVTLTNSGTNNINGTLEVRRIDDMVTVISTTVLSHTSSSGPNSASGEIPDWARPDADMWNTYFHSTSRYAAMRVQADGTFGLFYGQDGSAVSSTDAGARCSITYIV